MVTTKKHINSELQSCNIAETNPTDTSASFAHFVDLTKLTRESCKAISNFISDQQHSDRRTTAERVENLLSKLQH